MTQRQSAEDDATSAPLAPDAETPQVLAEKFVREAWGARNDDEMRVPVAKALELDPDCPDALAMLAHLTSDRGVAQQLLERAVSAAEERIGPELFAESAGHFSEVSETHSYARARLALARHLWDTGEREAAVEHATGLLELDPSDAQGLRPALLGWLLSAHKPAAAAKLMREFADEGSATWLWARALQLYQSFGKTLGSDAALADAIRANPIVVGYLAHVEALPDHVPDNFEIGSRGDAVIAVLLLADAWYTTEGALDWLVSVVNRTPVGPQPSESGLD